VLAAEPDAAAKVLGARFVVRLPAI